MRRVAMCMAVVGLGVALSPAAAQSATDITPPTLKTPIKSSWVVGGQLVNETSAWCDGSNQPGDGWVHASAPQQFKWRGSDDSGAVRYSILTRVNTGEDFYDPVDLGSQTSYSTFGGNANQACGGGGGYNSAWDVTARDASGNETTNTVSGSLYTLTQETGNADDSYRAVQPTIRYSGSWRMAYCACWSNGAVQKTTSAGASATVTVDLGASRPVTHLGLLAHKGPDRGKFKVYVDGALRSTVDLYAKASKPRIIVWQATLDNQRIHEVKIVNVGTAGRPRIDIDALLTN